MVIPSHLLRRASRREHPPNSATIGVMALDAGESVGAVTDVQSVAEVVRELADGAEGLLRVRA